jgi:hypothetical protein
MLAGFTRHRGVGWSAARLGLPVLLLLRDHFESLKLLKDFDGPMVLLAAHEDDLAPRAEASQALEQYFTPEQRIKHIHLIDERSSRQQGHGTAKKAPSAGPEPRFVAACRQHEQQLCSYNLYSCFFRTP